MDLDVTASKYLPTPVIDCRLRSRLAEVDAQNVILSGSS